MLPKDHALTPLAVSSADIPQFELKNDPASDKHILNQRRKTLQTISELSPHATAQGSTGSLSWASNDATIHGSPENLGSRHSRSSGRQSLPIQGSTSQRDYTGIPARSTAPSAASTQRRSGTTPNNLQGNTRHNPRRRSMPSSFEARGRSLSPVAEGELWRQPMPQHDSQLPGPDRNRSGKKQSHNVSRGKEQQGGWNARRERELIKRERALIDANAQRTRERLGLTIGSSPALPTVAPLPAAKSDDLIAQQSRYYSQLPSLSQPASINTSRRNSRGRNGRQANGSIIDGRLFQDIGSHSANDTDPHLGLRRSLSATSDPHWTSYRDPANRTIAPAIRSSSSNSFLGSALAERQLIDPRSSSSLQTSSTSTRSSSSKSSVSSSTTKPSQRSPSFTHARSSDHPLRQNPVVSSNHECGPALTQANLETNLPPPMSHAFLGSQIAAQATYLQTVPASPKSAPTRQRSRSRSRSQSRASAVHTQKVADEHDVIYRENPDKRGLSTSEPGNVMKKSSREEVERRAARERIKERVRRANELEEKKERELIEEGKKKKQQKKKSRGFLCGLFGKA